MIFLDSSVFDKPNNSSVTKGALSVLLYIIVVICLVGKALIKDYYSMLFCVLTLTLFIATAFTKKLFKIYITPFISSLILLFIFSAEILGEMCHLYTRISYWDAILHFTSGILFGAIGVSLFNRLNKTDILKTNLSPAVLVITIIGFSVFVGVLWEFFEFACDNWLKTDMQKDSFIDSIYSVALNQSEKNQTTRLYGIESFIVKGKTYNGGYLDIGLIDTMKDLAVNFAGAILFGIILYYHIKTKGKNRITSLFIEKTAE